MHTLKIIGICIVVIAVVAVLAFVFAMDRAEADGENPFQ